MRAPMIAFRYGMRTVPVVPPPVATRKAQLPAKFRPRPVTDDEMDFVRLGGAKPYELKQKK